MTEMQIPDKLVLELPIEKEAAANALYALYEAHCVIGKHGDDDELPEVLAQKIEQRKRVLGWLGELVATHETSLTAGEEGVTEQVMDDFIDIARDLNIVPVREYSPERYARNELWESQQ